jgi:hypothetical protein
MAGFCHGDVLYTEDGRGHTLETYQHGDTTYVRPR